MKVFRCPNCSKLMMKYKVMGHVSLEIKCPRCSELTVTTLIGSEYNGKKFRKRKLKGD
ncbi:Com family DNA-binding transcriptional regulator [Clostridium gasigenes]|uniref:Com family DNA-binding transcriptional regulator n=1 Tax=Clostridium gasigenes TaxID=94869 RepID=UPI001623CA50|nr:Com family DNA-binding transcriptional regulator [Clostridium gasigenes]MBB6625218.1 Com family DNA-binding transcriptional regulator [Clostridium gasigenes]